MSNESLDNNKIIEDLSLWVDLSKRTDEPPFVTYVFLQQVLDLIKRLQAENERLREILNTDFIIPLESDDTSSLVIVKIDSIKAEAHKEFAEKIKKHSYFDHKDQRNVVAEAIIDHYLKLDGDIDDSATDN